MKEVNAFGRSFVLPELTTSQNAQDGSCNEHQAFTCAAAIVGASVTKESSTTSVELIANAATPEPNRCSNCVATLALKELA